MIKAGGAHRQDKIINLNFQEARLAGFFIGTLKISCFCNAGGARPLERSFPNSKKTCVTLGKSANICYTLLVGPA